MRGSQLYAGTVSPSVLTHHTLIALLARRPLQNSHLYTFSSSRPLLRRRRIDIYIDEAEGAGK